jgi:hypothetical protein
MRILSPSLAGWMRSVNSSALRDLLLREANLWADSSDDSEWKCTRMSSTSSREKRNSLLVEVGQIGFL